MSEKRWIVTILILSTLVMGSIALIVSTLIKRSNATREEPARTPTAAREESARSPTTAEGEAIRLQFRPEPTEQRTLRVNSELASTYRTPYGEERNEFITAFTVEVKPTAIAEDGTVTLKITLLEMSRNDRMKSKDVPLFQYDSTRNSHEYSVSDAQYDAAIGESFTVLASARGEIIGLNLGDFFTAVAAKRLKYEDETYRRLPGGQEGEARIKERNEHYGSPEARKQAYEQEAPKSLLYGPDQLRLLASNVLVPLAPEPVKTGAEWNGLVMVSIEYPAEMAGTYTLKNVENGVCTIQAQAQRTPEDKLSSGPARRYAMMSKLGGTYQATLKVDRATGSLFSRESVMTLTGNIFRPGSQSANPEGDVPVTIEATTTVETVK